MARNLLSEWATFSLGPSGYAIALVFLITLALPLIVHIYFYRQRAAATLPTFLLVGPSGAGKTTLLTVLERGTPAATHTSQEPLTVECALPATAEAASNQYRSANDPSAQTRQKLLVVDTPGHGKLRHHALGNVVDPQNLKGIIFVVDAATLSDSSGGATTAEGGPQRQQGDNSLAEAAEYLHDVLLTLQRRRAGSKASKKGPAEVPVLIAANKLDLFTALPAKLVRNALEAEIGRLRSTRSKGLLDSGIGMDDAGGEDEEERETLGGGGEGKFEFGLMDEYGVHVEVAGGSATDAGGAAADVRQWWDWIARHV